MAEKTISQKIEAGFDKVLGIVTGLVERNPRKAAQGCGCDHRAGGARLRPVACD